MERFFLERAYDLQDTWIRVRSSNPNADACLQYVEAKCEFHQASEARRRRRRWKVSLPRQGNADVSAAGYSYISVTTMKSYLTPFGYAVLFGHSLAIDAGELDVFNQPIGGDTGMSLIPRCFVWSYASSVDLRPLFIRFSQHYVEGMTATGSIIPLFLRNGDERHPWNTCVPPDCHLEASEKYEAICREAGNRDADLLDRYYLQIRNAGG